MVALHAFIVNKGVFHASAVRKKMWIFGLKHPNSNPVIWVTNFAIYKAHLFALDNVIRPLLDVFLQECNRF